MRPVLASRGSRDDHRRLQDLYRVGHLWGRCSATWLGRAGIEASHQRQLGGTRVLWNALLSGEIDAYPEYTGTLLQEILVKENLQTEAQLNRPWLHMACA